MQTTLLISLGFAAVVGGGTAFYMKQTNTFSWKNLLIWSACAFGGVWLIYLATEYLGEL